MRTMKNAAAPAMDSVAASLQPNPPVGSTWGGITTTGAEYGTGATVGRFWVRAARFWLSSLISSALSGWGCSSCRAVSMCTVSPSRVRYTQKRTPPCPLQAPVLRVSLWVSSMQTHPMRNAPFGTLTRLFLCWRWRWLVGVSPACSLVRNISSMRACSLASMSGS